MQKEASENTEEKERAVRNPFNLLEKVFTLLTADVAIQSAAEFVPIVQLVRQCHDPKDDRFMEVALNGRADVIITGDADLLAMHPWREVAILPPTVT